MSETIALLGLKSMAKHVGTSVEMIRKFIDLGMPVARDESGMYISTTEDIDNWIREWIKKESKKSKKP